jgi:hypothetical protein
MRRRLAPWSRRQRKALIAGAFSVGLWLRGLLVATRRRRFWWCRLWWGGGGGVGGGEVVDAEVPVFGFADVGVSGGQDPFQVPVGQLCHLHVQVVFVVVVFLAQVGEVSVRGVPTVLPLLGVVEVAAGRGASAPGFAAGSVVVAKDRPRRRG